MSTISISESVASRRKFVNSILRGAALLTLGGGITELVLRASKRGLIWQIDPEKCIQCGRCETECVLETSAVSCVHDFPICGYCERCFGFFDPRAKSFETDGVNQLCPTGALSRKFVDDPYYEYQVDEDACIACGLCVNGCNRFGNGSLYLQVRYDRCLNCNECSIARNCPSGAFSRRPADKPYIFKSKGTSQI